jgi:hypothetical protein
MATRGASIDGKLLHLMRLVGRCSEHSAHIAAAFSTTQKVHVSQALHHRRAIRRGIKSGGLFHASVIRKQAPVFR